MCRPSLEPGGVSSAAETDADADADAGCDMESWTVENPAFPAGRGTLGGYWDDGMFELTLVKELAEADILDACWWRDLPVRVCFIINGALVEDGDS